MNKRRFVLFAACLAAGACGFWMARSSPAGSDSPIQTNPISRISDGTSESVARTRKPRLEMASPSKQRTPQQLAALKKDLMRSFANSSSPAHDWTLREQTAALLATLSVVELKEFAVELHPDGNLVSSTEDWQFPLTEQIYQAWGLKDPASACRSMNVFNDWLTRDPDAANAFFEQYRPTEEADAFAKSMQRSLLDHQALTDLQGTIQSLATVDPQTRQSMLLGWTRMFAHDPVKRHELVALFISINDPKVSESCLKSLIGEFSERSPSEAAALIETLAVSEELKDQLSHEVIGEWARKDPKQAFSAWLELGETEVPKAFYFALDEWSTNFPGVDEAIEWVNGMETAPVREQLKTHMIGHLAELERFSQAAKLSSGIEDSTERIRQMKLVRRIWGERYPEQASEWFSKLPPEVQAVVE